MEPLLNLTTPLPPKKTSLTLIMKGTQTPHLLSLFQSYLRGMGKIMQWEWLPETEDSGLMPEHSSIIAGTPSGIQIFLPQRELNFPLFSLLIKEHVGLCQLAKIEKGW